MIKPITYQGVGNFDSNLYALEVASRFIDNTAAHGYYKGYGTELAATTNGSNIIIGTGAFVVCARMNEITAPESVAVQITSGHVGYVIARIETYHPADAKNCTFVARTAPTLAEIPLAKENVFAPDTNTVNRAYELPLFSFSISGGGIANITKLIKPIEDYAIVKTIADSAQVAAANAVNTAAAATTTASTANATASAANATSVESKSIAQNADATSLAANKTAKAASDLVEELSTQIGEKQGTTVTIGGVATGRFEASGLVAETDTLILDGGKA